MSSLWMFCKFVYLAFLYICRCFPPFSEFRGFEMFLVLLTEITRSQVVAFTSQMNVADVK